MIPISVLHLLKFCLSGGQSWEARRAGAAKSSVPQDADKTEADSLQTRLLSWPYFEQEIGQDDLYRPLLTLDGL